MPTKAMFKVLPILSAFILVFSTVGLVACGEGETPASSETVTTSVAGATTTTDAPSATEASTATSATPAQPRPLLVAAAAGLKNAFTEIATAFDTTANAKTTLNFAASGQLRKQIEGGAPADVFASADVKQMEPVVKAGFVEAASVKTFASNTIVLIVPADSKLGITSFDDLAKPEVEKVATGDPEITPLGVATLEILAKLGMNDAVKPKLIYTQTVNQTLDYVSRGEVDVGIVWASEAQAGGDKVKVVATADSSWHAEVSFVIGVVRAGESRDLSQAFVDFVLGPEGQTILEKHGFVIFAK